MGLMHRLYKLLILLPVLVGCATGEPDSDSRDIAPDPVALVRDGIRVERNGDTVIYRGRLSEDGLLALRRAGDHPSVKTLLIDSAGGEVVVGMAYGDWISARGLDIVVDRACLSSCANYIFPAGRHKEIQPGAVVAWHGSAQQPGMLELLHQTVAEEIEAKGLSEAMKAKELASARHANVQYLTDAIRKQNLFFYRLGVDEYVTRIGNEKYGIRGFFYLSVADMEAFGIKNVTAPADYAQMEPRALARRVGFPVSLISLD